MAFGVAPGDRKLLREMGEVEQAGRLRQEVQAVMFVAVHSNCAGLLEVAYPANGSGSGALQIRREDDIGVVMLTGDQTVLPPRPWQDNSASTVSQPRLLPEHKN